MQSRRTNITTSGATAVVALLEHRVENEAVLKKTLHVANVGDSRAVLVSSQRPPMSPNQDSTIEFSESTTGYYGTRLSYDHRAEDVNEQKRIKDAGGFIARNRVLGILAVTRSFGDHGMKDFVTGSCLML